LAACARCSRFYEQLAGRQQLLKSLRRETAGPSECAGMRRSVMSAIGNPQGLSGWAWTVERSLMLGFRRHAFALASFAIVVIVSASLLAQMRQAAPESETSASVFEGSDSLLRPKGYRDWVFVGNGSHHAGGSAKASGNVYIDPAAYRQYTKSGKFPEGTTMVMELKNSESHKAGALLVSVKDSGRFAGGWGFFDFSGPSARSTPSVEAVSGCRSCHEQRAKTDHVFTQYYPALRSAGRESALALPRRTSPLHKDFILLGPASSA
jgi:hypothetical protein